MPHSIIFSLVTYKHSYSDILPLLDSIKSLAKLMNSVDILLYIYDATPSSELTLKSSDFISGTDSLFFYYSQGRNIGFGAAHNFNFGLIGNRFQFIFVPINPDIYFKPQSVSLFFEWLLDHSSSISCASPLVYNKPGVIQYSAKLNPTILSLLVGRFSFLKRLSLFSSYDYYHKQQKFDYSSTLINSSYLSGCFLAIPSYFYLSVGGFDENYFLHFEDADLVRRLSRIGKCVHFPHAFVFHRWARGSHRSVKQTLHLLYSAFYYFRTWGLKFF